MSYIKQSFAVFKDTSSIGINKVANGRLVYIISLKKFYIKDNSTDLISTTNIDDAIIHKNLISRGRRLTNNMLIMGGGNSVPKTISILSPIGVLVQQEFTINGGGAYDGAGVTAGIHAMFRSGQSNSITILTNSGIMLTPPGGKEVGTAKSGFSGSAVNSAVLFYGGQYSNLTTLLNYNGDLLQPEGAIGTGRGWISGANVGTNALFYAGAPYDVSNITTLLSPSATLVQAETNVGTARYGLVGASIGVLNNALFYGGLHSSFVNKTTILSPSATLVQAETNVGTARTQPAGANVGTNCLFSGGYANSYIPVQICTILTPVGVLAQTETTSQETYNQRNSAASV
jgi:hypothetical protein